MQKTLFDQIMGINILPSDGEAIFFPDFLDNNESGFFLHTLKEDYEFNQLMIHIYDKDVLQPRLTAFTGEPAGDLDYSMESLPVQPWSHNMKTLKEKVEGVAGVRFTHALLNLYRDGKDHVSWHRDKERHWGRNPVIASVSLGAGRTFQLRNYADRKIVRSIELSSGSLLIMRGTTNDRWEHRIVKTNKRLGERLNITFRILKAE